MTTAGKMVLGMMGPPRPKRMRMVPAGRRVVGFGGGGRHLPERVPLCRRKRPGDGDPCLHPDARARFDQRAEQLLTQLRREAPPNRPANRFRPPIPMPTTKRLIDAHAGRIDIDCPPGGGTIVTVQLPAELPALT